MAARQHVAHVLVRDGAEELDAVVQLRGGGGGSGDGGFVIGFPPRSINHAAAPLPPPHLVPLTHLLEEEPLGAVATDDEVHVGVPLADGGDDVDDEVDALRVGPGGGERERLLGSRVPY